MLLVNPYLAGAEFLYKNQQGKRGDNCLKRSTATTQFECQKRPWDNSGTIRKKQWQLSTTITPLVMLGNFALYFLHRLIFSFPDLYSIRLPLREKVEGIGEVGLIQPRNRRRGISCKGNQPSSKH
jgi:hypothetical protein